MKKLLLILALLAPFAAWGQSLGGRASVGVDCKVFKGFHVTAEEEVRTGDSFSTLGSLRTSVGVSYKPMKYLKVGLGGTLINPFKTGKSLSYEDTDGEKLTTSYTGFWAPRYRAFADVTGYLPLGDFQFSLRERLQLTHNADLSLNPYQSARNALALKSRIGVKYKRLDWLEPGLSFELRTALNDPWGTVSGAEQTTDSGKVFYDYTPAGYTHIYNNRYRFNLEADFKPARHHTLTPYVLFDIVSEYSVDTNKAGTKLFKATTGYTDGLFFQIGLGYVFSF